MVKKINQMPVKTWNWLKLNQAETDAPDNINNQDKISIHADNSSGITDELPFIFENGSGTGGTIDISVDENTDHIVLMDFKTENDASCQGYAEVMTKVRLEKKAKLTLVQVHRFASGFKFVGNIQADVGEKADLHLIQVFIRGDETYSDVRVGLGSKKSALHIDTGYLTTHDELLDINYVASHSGEQSISDISVDGSMCGSSVKRFRGTIDFQHGAVSAKGSEVENVLLLDDDVTNQTIPIILCEEEDVEGNHGATIGRLDDEVLEYMMSRGLDEDRIRDMMRKAYVGAVLRRIPDEAGEFADRICAEEGISE